MIDRLSSFFNKKLGLDINTKPILGIHYWEVESGHKQLNQNFVYHDQHYLSTNFKIAPESPPREVLDSYPNYFEKSTQNELEDLRSTHINFFMQSTSKALEIAEKLHIDLFGTKIPDDQPILRLRPDRVPEASNFTT